MELLISKDSIAQTHRFLLFVARLWQLLGLIAGVLLIFMGGWALDSLLLQGLLTILVGFAAILQGYFIGALIKLAIVIAQNMEVQIEATNQTNFQLRKLNNNLPSMLSCQNKSFIDYDLLQDTDTKAF